MLCGFVMWISVQNVFFLHVTTGLDWGNSYEKKMFDYIWWTLSQMKFLWKIQSDRVKTLSEIILNFQSTRCIFAVPRLACRFSMKIWENNSLTSIGPSSHKKLFIVWKKTFRYIFFENWFSSRDEFRVFLPRYCAAAMRKYCAALRGQVQKSTDQDEISTGILTPYNSQDHPRTRLIEFFYIN